MSWVSVIWSIGAGGCLTVALLHILVWWKNRAARANLAFAIAAISVATVAALELALMQADTPAQFGTIVRWIHVPVWVMLVSVILFVRFYLRAGRWWLAYAAIGVRTVSLILNFVLSPNINYRQITAVKHIRFLGEPVSVAQGSANPWMLVPQFSLVLLIAFIIDAMITVWRRGERRQALTVGGGLLVVVILGMAQSAAVASGLLAMPITISLFYQCLVAAMAYELSYDVIHAATLSRRLQTSEAGLRESEQRISLAAAAARLVIWAWDIRRDEVWLSDKDRSFLGFSPSEMLTAERVRSIVHSQDRQLVSQLVEKSLLTNNELEAEYRIVLPDGKVRWVSRRGRVEFEDGKPVWERGVLMDITERKLGEQAIAESEARFQNMANTAPVMIWMSGTDKLCTFFNKRWLEFTGRTIEQELGNGWAENVHLDDLQACLETYVEAFDAREPFVMQYRLKRHDGEYRRISDSGVPRYDAQQNFLGYIGSCIDITELLRKEEALRQFEERVALAAQAAHLGVWEFDPATNEIWISDSARALFGFDSDARITHAVFQNRLHPDDRAIRDSAVKKAIQTQGEYELEYRIVLPDGTLRWIGGRGRYVTAGNRQRGRLIGVSIDITSQKQAQDLFRLAVEASPSGIVLVSDSGEIVLVNSHIEELFGYPRDELVGKLVDILVPERSRAIHPEHRRKFLAAPEARAMGAGRELFARRKDGTEFPVEIGLNPIKTPNGKLVLAAVVDITARKQAELEALRYREELGHLSRVTVMGELAASIAHELNQPLSGITINASTGRRYIDGGNVDPNELRQLLDDIAADGRRAGEIIRDIQNMVRKGSSPRQSVNLNELITHVVRMVNPNAILQSCKLETVLEPNLPAVEANPVQLQQVLLNLVINAFDAAENADLAHRKVVIATQRNGDGTIRTSVRDYGPGIPEEVRSRLFEQFFTTKTKGLGMGLAIVRSIIKSHGGSIAAENAEGGGAVFHFSLPTTTSR